jgi:hypothetical protein
MVFENKERKQAAHSKEFNEQDKNDERTKELVQCQRERKIKKKEYTKIYNSLEKQYETNQYPNTIAPRPRPCRRTGSRKPIGTLS